MTCKMSILALAVLTATGCGASGPLEFECGSGEVLDCPPPRFVVEVTTVTGGQDLDDDGYRVVATFDGSYESDFRVETNGWVGFRYDLGTDEEGSRSFELTEVASNCAVDSPNPQSVQVSFGPPETTKEIEFFVTCTGP